MNKIEFTQYDYNLLAQATQEHHTPLTKNVAEAAERLFAVINP